MSIRPCAIPWPPPPGPMDGHFVCSRYLQRLTLNYYIVRVSEHAWLPLSTPFWEAVSPTFVVVSNVSAPFAV